MNKEKTCEPSDENFSIIDAGHFRCAEVLLCQIPVVHCLLFHCHHREGYCSECPEAVLHLFDHDTRLNSTAEIYREKTSVLPDETIVAVAPNVSVSRKRCRRTRCPSTEVHTLQHDMFRWPGCDFTECLMKNLIERGRLLMMFMRHWSTLSWIPTQSSKRPSGRRPASSQTETQFLPLTIVSVTCKCCSNQSDVDIRKNLYANVVTEKLCCSFCRLRHRAQTYGGNDKEKHLRAPKRNIITIGAKRCRNATVLFQTIFTVTSARFCMLMSCSQVTRPFSKEFVSTRCSILDVFKTVAPRERKYSIWRASTMNLALECPQLVQCLTSTFPFFYTY